MAFKRAIKTESKLRLALSGPSGSGKTFTALTLAHALTDGVGVAVIDTERKSASKYADIFPEFDVNEIGSFSPDAFIAAIKEAEQSGYQVLIIDSISHEWNGTGGVLEIVDIAAKRMKTANTYSAWGEGTPKHNSFIDAILRCNMHVICTMRSKEDYVQERIDGRTVIRKVGMAPIQRDGIMYEFDIAGELDHDHNLIIQKSRCPALSGALIAKPDGKVADTLKLWLSGVPQLEPATPKTVISPDIKKVLQPLASVSEVFNVQDALDKLYNRAIELHIIEDLVGWQGFKSEVFGCVMPDESITGKAQCEQLRQEIVRRVKDSRAKKEVTA